MITYFEYPHTVTEQEIDDLNHAGNFHYIKWMQHAAIEHSSANGWPPEKQKPTRIPEEVATSFEIVGD